LRSGGLRRDGEEQGGSEQAGVDEFSDEHDFLRGIEEDSACGSGEQCCSVGDERDRLVSM
jgi:hypothetical protein